MLEESGYTDMQKADRATGQTRLDNLKELTQSMQSFETLAPIWSTSRWSWIWIAARRRTPCRS